MIKCEGLSRWTCSSIFKKEAYFSFQKLYNVVWRTLFKLSWFCLYLNRRIRRLRAWDSTQVIVFLRAEVTLHPLRRCQRLTSLHTMDSTLIVCGWSICLRTDNRCKSPLTRCNSIRKTALRIIWKSLMDICRPRHSWVAIVAQPGRMLSVLRALSYGSTFTLIIYQAILKAFPLPSTLWHLVRMVIFILDSSLTLHVLWQVVAE